MSQTHSALLPYDTIFIYMATGYFSHWAAHSAHWTAYLTLRSRYAASCLLLTIHSALALMAHYSDSEGRMINFLTGSHHCTAGVLRKLMNIF